MLRFLENHFSLLWLKLKSYLEYDELLKITSQLQVCHILILSLGGLFLYCLYWLFFVPFDWTKQLDVTADSELHNTEKCVRSKNKETAINRLRRSRIVGSRDLPPPYPNGWYGILESSSLNAGESMYLACLGQHFVVYRTVENTVYILDAYCPHLGANLGLGGRVVGDNIECPFHKWSFRGTDGHCTNVPYSSCVPQATKVKKWLSNEMNGVIFVWYDAEETEKPWFLPRSPEVDSGQLVYLGRNEFYVNCHIQEIPENGADLAHFEAIHTASFTAGGFQPRSCWIHKLGVHDWNATWSPSEQQKHIAEVKLSHSFVFFKKFHSLEMKVTGRQIGPSYVQLLLNSPILGHFQIFQTITPIEPLLQKVVHRFYAPRILSPIMKILICGESIMFERDMQIWNHKMYRSNPTLVLEDSSLKKFRKWYSQFYTANSKTYQQTESLEW